MALVAANNFGASIYRPPVRKGKKVAKEGGREGGREGTSGLPCCQPAHLILTPIRPSLPPSLFFFPQAVVPSPLDDDDLVRSLVPQQR